MANKQIFRKVALDRLSSPEQLDQLMQVTTPYGWVALAALSALVVAAILWGFMAQIPNEISGQGILVRGGRIYTAVSTATGQISEMRVRTGDTVAAGQVIARVTTLPAGGASGAAVEVASPFGGRVDEVLAAQGSIVETGAPLITLEDTAQPLEAVLYLPLDEGTHIRPGMSVTVAPTIAAANAGELQGTVTSVGQYPASEQSMLYVMGNNEQLVKNFMAGGTVVEVRVSLANGAALQSGTLCRATIELGKLRPVNLLFPALGR